MITSLAAGFKVASKVLRSGEFVCRTRWRLRSSVADDRGRRPLWRTSIGSGSRPRSLSPANP